MTHAETLRALARDWSDDDLSPEAPYLREALKAGADALEAQEWRPIESAPKDGTLILCISPIDNVQTIVYHSVTHKKPNERWRIHRGGHTHLIAPTHWRPLPAPPKEEANDNT